MTNFDMNRYNVKAILDSPSLPIGSAAKRLKDVSHPVPSLMISSNVSESENNSSGWQNAAFQHHQGMDLSLLQQQQERYGGYNYNGGNLSSENSRVCFKQEEDQQQHFLSNSPSLMTTIDHHSSVSDDSVTVCGNVVGYGGYQGFAVPVGTSVNCDALAAAEIAYNARNHYYFAQQQQQIQQQSPEGDFQVAISNNVGSNMYFHGEGGGEGASTFTVWNDT